MSRSSRVQRPEGIDLDGLGHVMVRWVPSAERKAMGTLLGGSYATRLVERRYLPGRERATRLRR